MPMRSSLFSRILILVWALMGATLLADGNSWLIGAALLAAIAGAFTLSRGITRLAASMGSAARELAAGRFDARVRGEGYSELFELSSALNNLAETVERTVSELSQEKAHLDTILSNMIESVITVDVNGRVTGLNPATAQLFGVDRKEALGRPFIEAIRHGPLEEFLRAAIRSGSSQIEEIKILSPRERVFAAQIVPLSQDRAITGALAVLHDVTRLREVEQLRREFVANVSHELRTPIASIRGMAETLRTGALADRSARGEFVEAIETDAIRLGRLVDDLLDLSAIESGQRPPQLDAVDILKVAADAARRIGPLAKKAAVSISVEEGPPSRVLADSSQLGQVFINLLDNAVKFNRNGGWIKVRARSKAGHLEVEVEDSGVDGEYRRC